MRVDGEWVKLYEMSLECVETAKNEYKPVPNSYNMYKPYPLKHYR